MSNLYGGEFKWLGNVAQFILPYFYAKRQEEQKTFKKTLTADDSYWWL